MFNLCDKAWVNLNATPTPANPLNGYWLSFLFASTTAIASGKPPSCGGSWWSVTIVSIPRVLARATSSFPVIPQSTVIISVWPVSAIFLISLELRPYPSLNLFGM